MNIEEYKLKWVSKGVTSMFDFIGSVAIRIEKVSGFVGIESKIDTKMH